MNDIYQQTLKQIRLLVLDFDGVMTDNKVIVFQDGTEAVLCDRSDSFGIGLLKAIGTPTVVLSKEKNPVVTARCKKMDIPVMQAVDDKLPALKSMAEERGLEQSQVAYMGNDVNDLECLEWSGLSFAPADAHKDVLAAVKVVTKQSGGHGAVRQVADWLIEASRD